MVKKKRRYIKMQSASYDDQQRKDLLFAAILCFTIAVVCAVIII